MGKHGYKGHRQLSGRKGGGSVAHKGDRSSNQSKINKYFDVTGSGASISSTGLFNGLGNISQGATPTTRLSPRIRIMRVDYRIQLIASLQSAIATADIYNNLRVILGRCIGPQSLLSVANFPAIGLFPDERQEFEVLFDKTCFLKNVASGLAAAGAAYGPAPEGKWWIGSLEYNHEVLYDTASGATDSFNAPFYYAVSDSTVVPSPVINAAFRIWYQDMVI